MLYTAETISFPVIVLHSVIEDFPVCYKEESDVDIRLYTRNVYMLTEAHFQPDATLRIIIYN